MNKTKPAPQTTDEQIRTLIAGWADAIRARDIDEVVAHHDTDVVFYDVGPRNSGRASTTIGGLSKRFFRGWESKASGSSAI